MLLALALLIVFSPQNALAAESDIVTIESDKVEIAPMNAQIAPMASTIGAYNQDLIDLQTQLYSFSSGTATLQRNVSIASGEYLVIPPDITLSLGSFTITNNGQIISYGKISGGTLSGVVDCTDYFKIIKTSGVAVNVDSMRTGQPIVIDGEALTSSEWHAIKAKMSYTHAYFRSDQTLPASIFQGNSSNPNYSIRGLSGKGDVTINTQAFYYSYGIQYLSLPYTSEMPGTSTFQYSNSLTYAFLPRIVAIGGSSFYGDSSLKTVYMPKLRDIGSSAFSSCAALVKADFPAAINIESSAFASCSAINAFYLPKVQKIGEAAFTSCSAVTSLSLNTATSIGSYAFSACSNLSSLNISGATTLGNSPFRQCSKLPTSGTSINSSYFSKDVSAVYDRDKTRLISFFNASGTSDYSSTTVTSIDPYAFYYSNVKTVTMSLVETVGTYAFTGSSSMTSARFDKALTIENRAFQECSSLTGVTAGILTKIGEWAFYNCDSLGSVNYPYVTDLGRYAFYDCDKLTSVTFTRATSIPEQAFYSCDLLSSISFPAATSIGDHTFYNCQKLTSVTFSAVTSVSSYAFSSCSGLTTVYFNCTGATSLGSYVFWDCSALTTVRMSYVTSVGSDIFKGCTALTSSGVNYYNSSYFTSSGGIFYSKDMTRIIHVFKDYSATSINNSSITKIDPYAFYGRTTLTSVTFPNVTSIGEYAFASCTGLQSISFASQRSSIGSYAFSSCTKLTNVSMPVLTNTGANTFQSCTGLSSITLPALTTVGSEAFYNCTSLSSVTLPEVTSVGNYGFRSCSSLSNISIPKATSLGYYAFQSSGLTKAEFPLIKSINYYAFDSCPKLTEINLPELTTFSNVDSGYTFGRCPLLTTVKLPKATGTLPYYAFYACPKLKTVEIPNVSYIGNQAFYNCTALTDISMDNVIQIYSQGFYNCSALESISAPKLSSAGSYAFYNANKLNSINLPTLTSAGQYMFQNCTALKKAEFEVLKTIPAYMFSGCNSLTELSLPAAELLDNNAIYGVAALDYLYLPSIKTIGTGPMPKYLCFGVNVPTMSTTSARTEIKENSVVFAPNNKLSSYNAAYRTSYKIPESAIFEPYTKETEYMQLAIGTDVTFNYPELAGIKSVWLKNSTAISGASGNSYSKANLKIADSGVYTYKVDAPYFPVITRSVNLAVKNINHDAPSIPKFVTRTDTTIELREYDPTTEFSLGNEKDWIATPKWTGLTADTEYTIYIRYKPQDDYLPSDSNSMVVKTKALQLAPQPPQVTSRTDTSVSYVAECGMEYSVNGIDFTAETITGLKADTVYQLYARLVETEDFAPSPVSYGSKFRTKYIPEPPPAPVISEIGAGYIIISDDYANPEYEYRVDDGEWQSGTRLTGLVSGEPYSITARIKETTTHVELRDNINSDASKITRVITLKVNPIVPTTPTIIKLRHDYVLYDIWEETGFETEYEITQLLYSNVYSEPITGLSVETTADGFMIKDQLLKGVSYKIRRRLAQTAEFLPSVWSEYVEFTVKAEPSISASAPIIVSYSDTEIIIETNTLYEYSIDGGETWQSESSFKGLTPITEYSIVKRVKESDTSIESEISDPAVVATKGKPARPEPATSHTITADSIRVNVVSGQEYSLDTIVWNKSGYFTNLSENAEYEIYTRTYETDDNVCSEISEAAIFTTKSVPALPILTLGYGIVKSKTDYSITILADENWDYSIDGGESWLHSSTGLITFNPLDKSTVYEIIGRLSETETQMPSAPTDPIYVRTLAKEYEEVRTPVLLSKADTWLRVETDEGYEYSINEALTWQKSGMFTELAENTQYSIITRKAATEETAAGQYGTPLKVTTKAFPADLEVAPILVHKSSTTITLKHMEGYEYSREIDGNIVAWQKSAEFKGLQFSTSYSFVQRIAETNNKMPSKVSPTAIYSTIGTSDLPDSEEYPYIESYSDTTITIGGENLDVWEYSINGGVTWFSEPLIENLQSNWQYVVLSRIAATDDNAASASTEIGRVITKLSTSNIGVPSAPELISKTDILIMIKENAECEYKIEKPSTDIVQRSGKFENLLADTEYLIYARYLETDTAMRSNWSQPLSVTTKKTYDIEAKISSPVMDSRTECEIVLNEVEGYEYSIDNGETWHDSNIFESLEANTEYTFTQRVKETSDTMMSNISDEIIIKTKDIPAVPEAPTLESKSNDTVVLVWDSAFEYSKDGGETWQSSNTFKSLEAGTEYTFVSRVRGTDDNIASGVSEGLTVMTKTVPAKPAAPTILVRTNNMIQLEILDGAMYSMDGENWQSSSVFTGLSESTEYSFAIYFLETDEAMKSPISEAVKAKTKFIPQTPEMPELVSVTQSTIEIEIVEGVSYSIDGGETWQGEGIFEGLEASTEYEIIAKILENDDCMDSDESEALLVTTSRKPIPPTPEPPPPEPSFIFDTETKHRYLYGYDDGTVRPNENITREEVSAMIYRLLKEEAKKQNVDIYPFPDISSKRWSYDEVTTLHSLGLIKGYGDGTFRPTAYITRGELVSILSRLSDFSYDGPDYFTDISKHWARADINLVASFGWIKGYNDGIFKPNAPITRAETAAILNRMLNRSPKSPEDLPENMPVFSDNLETNAWYYLDVQEACVGEADEMVEFRDEEAKVGDTYSNLSSSVIEYE